MLRLVGVALLLLACRSGEDSAAAVRTQPIATQERTDATHLAIATNATSTEPIVATPTLAPPTATAFPTVTSEPTRAASAPQSSGQLPQRVEPVRVELRAQNLKFSLDSLSVPAHAEVTFVLHNDDLTVLHDIGAGLPGVGHSEACAGPCTVSLTFVAHEPGRYDFFCSVHPEMVGDLVVTP